MHIIFIFIIFCIKSVYGLYLIFKRPDIFEVRNSMAFNKKWADTFKDIYQDLKKKYIFFFDKNFIPIFFFK